jgi:hypothetical protein
VARLSGKVYCNSTETYENEMAEAGSKVAELTIGCAMDCIIRKLLKNMVEAVGVEPTSENVTGQEPTYLVQFTRRELPRQIRALRLERTRNVKR